MQVYGNRKMTNKVIYNSSIFYWYFKFLPGEYNLNGLEGYEQNVTIEKIFKHPDYDGRDFDVALVKLNTTIKYNSHVRPVCLPKTDLEPQTICYVTGWGHTSEGGNIARVIVKIW